MLKNLVLVSLAVALLGILAPPVAHAKSASQATIAGPGIDQPIEITGEGDVGGSVLMQIAEGAGFFGAVFGQSPDPMLDARPAGSLGPRYTVTYVMPGPSSGLDTIVQDVYPFAKPAPVSYTRPGQRFWTTERTHGGWYVAASSLEHDLVAAGVPVTPRAITRSDGFSGPVVWAVAVLLATAVLSVLAGRHYVVRRRSRSVTA